MYKVSYTINAEKDLRNMDFKVAQRIIKKIYFFSIQKDPLKFAKRLKNAELGTHRFRIGDYRALFDIDHSGKITLLMILKIKHRKDVYGM